MKPFEAHKRLIRFISAYGLLLLDIAVYWAFWTGHLNQMIEFPFWRRGNWLMAALYGVLLAFFFHTYGGFRIGYLKKNNLICSQMLSVVWVNLLTYLQISLIDKRFHGPGTMLLMTVCEFLLGFLWTTLFQAIYQHMFPPRRLLLVYGQRPAFHLMEKVHSRKDKYWLAGSVDIRVGINKIMRLAGEYDGVIVGDLPSEERNELLKLCYQKDLRTYTVPKISDILIRTSSELDIFDSPLLLSRNDGLSRDQELIKRCIDIVFSAIGLLVTSPLFLLIAISVKLTDGGPVFYKQARLTKNRKIFEIYKFRTMVQDAEKKDGPRLASEGDDRILPVGRILRRTRLDELPQLLNILRGDMTLVGPRPERPELAAEIEEDIPEFCFRLKVKAGLTGYAQVYGKYNTSSYDKLKLDLIYIRNYSLLLDLKLILMTPKVMPLKESTEGVKA